MQVAPTNERQNKLDPLYRPFGVLVLLRPKFHAKLLPKLSAAPELPRHMTDYSLFARNLSVFGQTHDWRIDPVTNKCADLARRA